MHEHSLARCEIGDDDRHNSRRENNESALRAPGETPARKLFHHSRGKARIVDVGRFVTQSRIEQLIGCIVHLQVAHTASIFFNLSRPRNTFVFTVPSGMSSTLAASS